MSPSAIHIRTTGFQCPVCPQVIRRALKGVPGVLDVVAVASLSITSVLYDADSVATTDLHALLESLGYKTTRSA